MANNTFTKNYVDGDALLEDDLDTGYESLQPSIANMAFSTTGSASGDILASTGSNLAPNYISPNTFAATITSAGANAIFGDVTSCVATVANLVINNISSCSSTSANIIGLAMTATAANSIGLAMTATAANSIGVAMTASGANAVIATANSVSVPTAVLANNIINAISSCSSTSANIIAASVVRVSSISVGVLGVAISPSSGLYTNTTTTYANVTNLSVIITTSGRPVVITCTGHSGSTISYVAVSTTGTATTASALPYQADIRIIRDSVVEMYQGSLGHLADKSTTAAQPVMFIPPSSIFYIDTPVAGTYTYEVQTRVGASSDANATAEFRNVKMVAYEI